MNITINPSAIRFGNSEQVENYPGVFGVGAEEKIHIQTLIYSVDTSNFEEIYTAELEKAYGEDPEQLREALETAPEDKQNFLRRTSLFLLNKAQFLEAQQN